MNHPTLAIKKLHPNATIPRYAHQGDAGMDLTAVDGCTIQPGQTALVPTGLALAIPLGYEGQVRPRSGLALKHRVTVLNSPGTIDAGYRGEVGVILINHGAKDFAVEVGMRIAQLVIAPVAQAQLEVVDDLDDTTRSSGGFGSTGA